jgi:protein tyrosine/serine phosphatase
VSNPKRTPVLVHCLHGSDRTGTMCALYRIAIQGWSKEDALKEMVEGGYGFHGVFQNLLDYLDELDIDDIKRKAAVAAKDDDG